MCWLRAGCEHDSSASLSKLYLAVLLDEGVDSCILALRVQQMSEVGGVSICFYRLYSDPLMAIID